MTRSTNAVNFVMSPSDEARARMSDEERAELGRAQIAAGDYIEGVELEAFLDSLMITVDKAQ